MPATAKVGEADARHQSLQCRERAPCLGQPSEMRIGRNQCPVGGIVIWILGKGALGPIEGLLKVPELQMGMGNSVHRLIGIVGAQSDHAVKDGHGGVKAAGHHVTNSREGQHTHIVRIEVKRAVEEPHGLIVFLSQLQQHNPTSGEHHGIVTANGEGSLRKPKALLSIVRTQRRPSHGYSVFKPEGRSGKGGRVIWLDSDCPIEEFERGCILLGCIALSFCNPRRQRS